MRSIIIKRDDHKKYEIEVISSTPAEAFVCTLKCPKCEDTWTQVVYSKLVLSCGNCDIWVGVEII